MKKKPKKKKVKKTEVVQKTGGQRMSALVVQAQVPQIAGQVPVPQVDTKTVLDYIFSSSLNLNEKQKNLFCQVAVKYNLDPFKREIHATGYRDRKTGEFKLSIVTGYEVYLKRAERSGRLQGWSAGTTGSGKDLKAWVKIHRKDWSEPFYHEVDLEEYIQRKSDGTVTRFWADKPRTMLKKVAISQGFRLAFPDELGGIPYTPDELPPEMGLDHVQETPGGHQRAFPPAQGPETQGGEKDVNQGQEARRGVFLGPVVDIVPPTPSEAPDRTTISYKEKISRARILWKKLQAKDPNRYTDEIFGRSTNMATEEDLVVMIAELAKDLTELSKNGGK